MKGRRLGPNLRNVETTSVQLIISRISLVYGTALTLFFNYFIFWHKISLLAFVTLMRSATTILAQTFLNTYTAFICWNEFKSKSENSRIRYLNRAKFLVS